MIVALYGSPGLSFAELTYMMTELGIGFMAVKDRPQKIGDPSPKHVIPVIFNSGSSFLKNKNKIKFRSVVFVCESYTKLKREYGWPMIGVIQGKKNQHSYIQFDKKELGLLLQEADQLTVPIDLSSIKSVQKVYDPASEMISKFSKSALSQAQTMMYKVKNQELRSKTFELVREWFVGKAKSKDALKTNLHRLHKNPKYVDDLTIILTSPLGMSLRRATTESRKDPKKLEILAKKANLSPFDIRYLLSKGKR